jgi:hypothetical protein
MMIGCFPVKVIFFVRKDSKLPDAALLYAAPGGGTDEGQKHC